MKNIENFNFCTAHILTTLYGEFPVRYKLDPSAIVSALNGAIVDDEVRKINATTFVMNTIMWLVDTGYLIKHEGSSAATNRYVLSPKAFEALSAPLPEALGGEKGNPSQKTVGEKLSELAVNTGKDVGKEAKAQSIRQAIGWIIGLALS